VVEAQFFPLTVTSTTPETDNAIKIGFGIPIEFLDRFRYKPGQYLTIRSEADVNSLRRSYSICSGVNDPELQIAIKRIEGGQFSNFVNDSIKVGDIIHAMPPEGNFSATLDKDHVKQYLFIAAGSGITPVFSNIKSILEEEPGSRVTLLYGNQRTNTIMFRDALSFLKNRYMTRLHWINLLSREDQGADLLNGRLDNKKGSALNQTLIELDSFDDYFICGPESMISEVSRGLRGIGVKDADIHYELFSSSAEDAQLIVQKHQARARQFAGKMSHVTMVMDGRSVDFELSADGANLLDSGIDQGMDLPYSCRDGVCATCKAKLLEGKVDMDITHGLESKEIENGFILTCQAHPISDQVVVDFDHK